MAHVNKVEIVILAIIPCCIAIAVWWLHPQIAFDTDSPRYMAASPMRTATYPLFLRATYGPALLPIQLLLFAAALSWLALYSSKFLSWVVSAAMVLAMAANPYVWQLQGTVMSEALTTPLLTIIVGCLLGFTATNRPSLAIIAGLLCGIATTARPSLFPLILTPLCAVWIGRTLPARGWLCVVILVAFMVPIAIERLYSHAVHGAELTSPMGRQLFMKAAVIDAPPSAMNSTDPLDRELVQELNNDYAPVRRLLDTTKDRDVRLILLTNYEGCAGWGCFTNVWARFGVPEAELHRHLFRIGLARLESNPLGYLKLTASEYPKMWLLHQRKLPTIAPKYNAFLANERPIPFQRELGEEGQPTPASQQKRILFINRVAFATIGLLAALMTIGFAFWRRQPRARAALCLLLGTQGVLIFSAFVGSGLVRYAMGMWPTVIAAELLGIVALLDVWKPRLASARVKPHLRNKQAREV